MKRLRSYGLLLLLIHPLNVFSQQIFEHITTANGLSNNIVMSVLQDREGFYWIATVDGLNRFDGSSFKVFRNERNNPNSLAHNLCNYLLEDNEGNIWVATYNGVSIYKKKEGKFHNIYLKHPDIKPDILNRIGHLAKDGEGNIWIGGFLLWKYTISSQQLQYYSNEVNDKTSISGNGINSLCYDKRNNGMWIGTAADFNFFDFSTKQFFHKKNDPRKWKIFDMEGQGRLTMDEKVGRIWFYDNSKKRFCSFDLNSFFVTETSVSSSTLPRTIQVDKQSRVWISFWDKGSLVYDPLTEITDSNFFNKFHSRSALFIRFNHLYFDKTENIWISSNRGISIYNNSYVFMNLYELDYPELNNNEAEDFRISAIAPSGVNSVWLGSNRSGLFHFNLTTRKLRRISSSLIDHSIGTLFSENDSILWLGTTTTLYKFNCYNEKIIAIIEIGKTIEFISGDGAGNILVGDWTDGLYKLTSSGKIRKHFLHKENETGSLPFNNLICVSKWNNVIWIGMNAGNGFTKYDPQSDTFTPFNPRTNDSTNKEYGTINGIATADGNTFLIGTHGGGVYLWNKQNNTYKQFNEEDGIDGSFINSVLPDKNGSYWISTTNGINFFEKRSQKFTHIKIDFSFTTNAFNANGISTADGSLLLFCGKKLLKVRPELYNSSGYDTKTLVSSFKVFDKDLSPSLSDSVIRLTYKQNFFSLEYSALKSSPGAGTRYAYRLEGFDKNWIDAGARHYVSYTNVPAGSYRFLVKAANERGEWSNDITAIHIMISPPFWKTWWFYSLCGLTLIALFYLLYSYRINQLKKLMAVRARISQDLHDEVGAALSSIHVYSSVASKAMEKDTGKAREALTNINQNTRQVMENMSDIVWAINTGQVGEPSLESKLKNYGYELLTPLNIACIYWIDKEADKKITNIEARKNVLLIVKEAMNNIAKYSEATEAMVKLEFRHKNLQLEIGDNGRGFDENGNRPGNGLHNMRKRTESLGGSFLFNSAKTKGTIIRCRIPLTNISD